MKGTDHGGQGSFERLGSSGQRCRIAGDSKLESEGKAEKAAGKVQNTIGGIKDSVRGK
jgi:hypothetical protein